LHHVLQPLFGYLAPVCCVHANVYLDLDVGLLPAMWGKGQSRGLDFFRPRAQGKPETQLEVSAGLGGERRWYPGWASIP
jgi:hypothetical protein